MGMIRVLPLVNRKPHLLVDVGRWRLPAHHDEYPRVSCGCSLTTQSEREVLSDRQSWAGWTHLENLEDHKEVLFPSGERIFIAHCVEKSGSHISFTLFDDLPLYFCHCPVIWSIVRESLGVRIAGSTYVVSCWIASSTA